jgi:hypothetical protein
MLGENKLSFIKHGINNIISVEMKAVFCLIILQVTACPMCSNYSSVMTVLLSQTKICQIPCLHCKQFFPHVQDRLKLKINTTPIFAVMVTGQGKTRAYLHRFKLMEHAKCVCNKGDQTIDHLINQCTLLHTQRELLKSNVLQFWNWPLSKCELINKHMKSFLTFIKSIDFDQL